MIETISSVELIDQNEQLIEKMYEDGWHVEMYTSRLHRPAEIHWRCYGFKESTYFYGDGRTLQEAICQMCTNYKNKKGFTSPDYLQEFSR